MYTLSNRPMTRQGQRQDQNKGTMQYKPNAHGINSQQNMRTGPVTLGTHDWFTIL